MNETLRTVYQINHAIRKALEGPLFPDGDYNRKQVVEILVKNEVVRPWELGPSTIKNATLQVQGWSHNGKYARESVWTKKTAPATPQPSLFTEPEEDTPPRCPGTFTLRVERIERLLVRLCESLNLPTD